MAAVRVAFPSPRVPTLLRPQRFTAPHFQAVKTAKSPLPFRCHFTGPKWPFCPFAVARVSRKNEREHAETPDRLVVTPAGSRRVWAPGFQGGVHTRLGAGAGAG